MPSNKESRKRGPPSGPRDYSAGAGSDRRGDRRTSRGPRSGRSGAGAKGGRARGAGGGDIWLYGRHAALAALANPARLISALRVTENFLESHGDVIAARASGRDCAVETVEPAQLDRLVGAGAAHQGLVVAARPLDQPDVAELRPGGDDALVVVLDQASDPRNVGAVIRSAAAFGAMAVVTTQRGAPPETGALAKAAVGCLESIPYVQATNLVRALDALKANGFWTIGLEGQAHMPLADAPFDRPIALVMGAEDRGLRRLTAEACDALVRIPIAPGVESLNVATAAAIALYERRRANGRATV